MHCRGIGNDIIEIERLRRALKNHGTRLLNRLFSKREQDYCKQHRDPIPSYAGRFAAKEAIVKALGCGFGRQASWLDIEILSDAFGRPEVLLSERLNIAFDDPQIFLSISHEKRYATAVALWQE